MAEQQQVSKIKKKQWFQIVSPAPFENMVIGETLVYDPEAMLGKTLVHSLMNLTNDIKRQNINIHFKVTSIDSGKGNTSIIGYEIVPSSIKRFVRRNTVKIVDSITCETADNLLLRVKPLVITRGSVKGSISTRLRHSANQHLQKTIKKMKFNEIINELISHKLQSGMREALNKIYPLKVCEIRFLSIEKEGIAPAEEPAEAAQAETATAEEASADEETTEEAPEVQEQQQ